MSGIRLLPICLLLSLPLRAAECSDDLAEWHPLEEGGHYTVTANTVTDEMRTLEWGLLPGQPPARFFRQKFGE